MTEDSDSIEDLLLEIAPSGDPTGSTDELIDQKRVLGALRRKLIERVDDLLINRRNYLMSLLYRIDVKESLVVAALGDLPPDEIAPHLADLIIERQIEKVRSRRSYRGSA